MVRSIRNRRRFDSMQTERAVTIDSQEYVVVISDETEALLAARTAGRAVLGLLGETERGPEAGQGLWAASYLIESLDALDDRFLERVVRRHLGLPWVIAQTERLLIREFQAEDAARIPHEDADTEADRIFCDSETLAEYIRCQYRFYEYGIWALVDKESGELVGKAGLSSWEGEAEASGCIREDIGEKHVMELELGYHIFTPYRRRGYAAEACRAILAYAQEQWDSCRIYAKIDASNEASIRVIHSCGFKLLNQACNGALQYSYPCAECSR